MKFLSSERLSAHKYKTPEGYLICTDAILARTGMQTYHKNEVFADSDDMSEINVYRSPEEVFSEEALASFENKPITVEHPNETVSPYNHNSLSVGFVRDVRKGKIDEQDVMLGTLVITDSDAIDDIESGKYVELSCGYDCDIVDEAHPQQRNIRGNHVALCQQGRAGIARIVDSIKESTYDATLRQNDNIDTIPLRARQEMSASENKVATLLSILNELQQEVDSASTKEKEMIKTKANKILDDLKRQFNLTSEKYIKLDDNIKKYGITPLLLWQKSKKIEKYEDDIDIARNLKQHLERADGINYVIIDMNTMQIVDSDVNVHDTDRLEYAIWVKINDKWKIWGGSSSAIIDKQKFIKLGYDDVKVVKNGEDITDTFMSKMQMPEQSLNDAKSISQLRQDIHKLLVKAKLNPDDSTLRDFAQEYRYVITQSDEWFLKNKSFIEEDLSMFKNELKDCITDSLVDYEYQLIDDIIKSIKFKTVSDVLDELNRQYPGFVGNNMTEIINYLNKKNIKDSHDYIISYHDNNITHIKKIKAKSLIEAIKKSK